MRKFTHIIRVLREQSFSSDIDDFLLFQTFSRNASSGSTVRVNNWLTKKVATKSQETAIHDPT